MPRSQRLRQHPDGPRVVVVDELRGELGACACDDAGFEHGGHECDAECVGRASSQGKRALPVASLGPHEETGSLRGDPLRDRDASLLHSRPCLSCERRDGQRREARVVVPLGQRSARRRKQEPHRTLPALDVRPRLHDARFPRRIRARK